MSTTSIRAALEAERSQVVSTIVAGFITDPVARWCFPGCDSYLAHMPEFVNAYGGKAFENGTAWVEEHLSGAALWLPPGEGPDEEALGAFVSSAIAPEKQGPLLAALEELGGYHPHEPHWFLPLIAVDPHCHGHGLGTQLMSHAIAKCDETGSRAYLESSNPRNITLYERHGFRVAGEVRSGGCPVFTAMLRAPQ